MDESDGLENRYGGNLIVGSNPTPSARSAKQMCLGGFLPNHSTGSIPSATQETGSPRDLGLIGVGIACTAGSTFSAKSRRLFSALSLGIPP